MSDIGVISHEYQTASELTKKINDALIVIKKVHYQLASSKTLSDGEISQSRQLISDILHKLMVALSTKVQKEVAPVTQEVDLPGSLLQRIRIKQKPKIVYYLADLKKVTEHLEKGIDHLTEEDFGLLDEMCAAADTQTATIFQKFWKE
jgi:uncharacterized protein YfdQ (DUF2303 family)